MNKKARITHIVSEKLEEDCDLLVNWNGKMSKEKVVEVFDMIEKILNEAGEEHSLISAKNLVVNKKGRSEPKIAIDGTRYTAPSSDTKVLRYQAPELVQELSPTKVSHFWTLGVLLFEKENQGLNPFETNKALVMKRMIQYYPVNFSRTQQQDPELRALVMELLNKSPDQRLGSEGFQEIRSHAFFN